MEKGKVVEIKERPMNRVIYNNNVYYRLNDVVRAYDLIGRTIDFNVALKNNNVNICKLTGFGNSYFISEEAVNSIEVNGIKNEFKTEFKDLSKKLLDTSKNPNAEDKNS